MLITVCGGDGDGCLSVNGTVFPQATPQTGGYNLTISGRSVQALNRTRCYFGTFETVPVYVSGTADSMTFRCRAPDMSSVYPGPEWIPFRIAGDPDGFASVIPLFVWRT